MKNKSQKDRIIGQLVRYGFISRNACLKNYISRLSAIILDLKKEGWGFEAHDEMGDYVYSVTKMPFKYAMRRENLLQLEDVK